MNIPKEARNFFASKSQRVTALFFDNDGNLLPLDPGHLDIESQPTAVTHYTRLSTNTLISKAHEGNVDMELYMELHRRARDWFANNGTTYKWDASAGTVNRHEHNRGILQEYDERWDVAVSRLRAFRVWV